MVATTNLISYYKIDEASGTAEDSHSTNDLTNSGVTMNQSGKINTCGLWDSSTDKLQDTDFPLPSNGEFALNMWVYLDTQGNFDTLVNINDGSDDINIYYGNGWKFSSWNGATVKATSPAITSTAYLDKWTMVTVTKDSTNMKLYLDGSEVGTIATQSNTLGTTRLTLGNNVGATTRAPDGYIDEVSIWDSLSTDDISDLYNSGSGLAYPFSSGPDFTKLQLNIGDSWKAGADMKINIGDSWKDVTDVQINIGDSWKSVV